MTRIGRILRRYSPDELPQLVNVILGHMSFVGRRPLPITDVEEKLHDPKLQYWIEKRESVLAGITGLWQVRGRSELGFKEMLALISSTSRSSPGFWTFKSLRGRFLWWLWERGPIDRSVLS